MDNQPDKKFLDETELAASAANYRQQAEANRSQAAALRASAATYEEAAMKCDGAAVAIENLLNISYGPGYKDETPPLGIPE